MDGSCYVRNDNALQAFAGSLTVSLLALATGRETVVSTAPLALPRGGGAFQYACMGGSGSPFNSTCPPISAVLGAAGCKGDGSDCVAYVRVVEGGSGVAVDENLQLLAPPYKLALPAAAVSAAVEEGVPPRAGDGARSILVTSDAVALYVLLTSLAQGRFEDNFFLLPGGQVRTWFIPFEGFDAGELTESLRVEHVAMYL